MNRLLYIFVSVLFLNAALAGCFGGGDDDDDDPTPSPTASPTNTTDPFANAKRPPVAVMAISVDGDGTAIEGPPFLIKVGTATNVTFDANASSDPDGTIERHSWVIQPPMGDPVLSANESFKLDLGKMRRADGFGVYHVTLRVLDNDGIISVAEQYFALDYLNTYTLDGMIGPGTAARDDTQETEAQGAVSGIRRGTFKVEEFNVQGNASSVHLNLTFTPGLGDAKMKLYLFDTSVNASDETGAATPVAESDSAASPIALAYEPATTPPAGRWWARVELDGPRIEEYTLEVKVLYKVPELPPPTTGGGSDGGNGTDNGTDNGTETSMGRLPLPPLPDDDDPATRDGRDGTA